MNPVAPTQQPRSDSQHWQWGLAWLVLAIVVSLANLLRAGVSGHYNIFSDAALKLWHDLSPYGVSYDYGRFIYPPSCGLFFYGLFAWMPYSLGLELYMGSSSLLFVYGLQRWSKQLNYNKGAFNVFLFLAASEVIGTILNARLELFIVAMNLLSVSFIIERKKLPLAYFLLATACSFKFQSLPTVGLLLIYEMVAERTFKPLLYFSLSIAFWILAPFTVKNYSIVIEWYQAWVQALGSMATDAWLSFQHVFRFWNKLTGFTPNWKICQYITLGLGLIFAAYIFRLSLLQRLSGTTANRARNISWCLGLGGLHIAALSPTSQSAAYILYVPMLGLALYLASNDTHRVRRYAAYALVAVSWILCSVLYSDLVPKSIKAVSFDMAVKAPGALLLVLVMILYRHADAVRPPQVQGTADL